MFITTECSENELVFKNSLFTPNSASFWIVPYSFCFRQIPRGSGQQPEQSQDTSVHLASLSGSPAHRWPGEWDVGTGPASAGTAGSAGGWS